MHSKKQSLRNTNVRVHGFSTYPDDLPYKMMRSVLASMGALCAPMAYLTLRALRQAPAAAILAAFMIIFGMIGSLHLSLECSQFALRLSFSLVLTCEWYTADR